MVKRILSHLRSGRSNVRRHFPVHCLKAIESAITRSEIAQRGEIRVVIEPRLELDSLLSNISARDRAVELFSNLRVWDTEANNGVLIYLLLAEHNIEIVADRGVMKVINQAELESICKEIEDAFRNGQFESGLILGIERLSEILKVHFPIGPRDPNEIPDSVLVI